MTEKEKADVLIEMHREVARKYGRDSLIYVTDPCGAEEKAERKDLLKKEGDRTQALWWAIEAVAKLYPELGIDTGRNVPDYGPRKAKQND